MRIDDIHTVRNSVDRTVYIIGTGASLRCMPLDFFCGKLTLGLNQAWRHLPTTFSITAHPELLDDYEKAAATSGFKNRTQWIVKKKPPRAHLELNDPNFYVFGTSTDLAAVRERPADTLYLGEGIQTTAMDLAARMGARTVVLVGCDAKKLRGDYHAHDQHVRWLGVKPEQQYALYRKNTAQVRTVLRTLGVAVISLSPFIGIDAGEEDYNRLCSELKLSPLPPPKDTSPYKRKLPRK